MLDGWPGTLIVISHDRYLIERICDSVFALFGDGDVTHLPGGIDEFLDRQRSMADHAASGTGFAAGTEAIATGSQQKQGSLSAAEKHKISKEMNSLERKIAKVQKREEKIQQDMADVASSSNGADTEKLTELDRDLSQAREEREELEMVWMEYGEKLEQQ